MTDTEEQSGTCTSGPEQLDGGDLEREADEIMSIFNEAAPDYSPDLEWFGMTLDQKTEEQQFVMEAEKYIDRYGLDAELVHYGIDTDRWDWRERERHDPLRILTVCRLVERKRLDAAVDAVSTLRSEHGVRARHRIVGDGPLRETVADWATRPWVEYRGYADDLQAEYDWADLFLLPSAHEAFGMVFCEALACGLPVVTSPWGGQTDIVTSAVGRYPDTDAGETLADSLQRVVVDYEHFQWETDGHVEALFSVDQMVNNYETLFQKQ